MRFLSKKPSPEPQPDKEYAFVESLMEQANKPQSAERVAAAAETLSTFDFEHPVFKPKVFIDKDSPQLANQKGPHSDDERAYLQTVQRRNGLFHLRSIIDGSGLTRLVPLEHKREYTTHALGYIAAETREGKTLEQIESDATEASDALFVIGQDLASRVAMREEYPSTHEWTIP